MQTQSEGLTLNLVRVGCHLHQSLAGILEWSARKESQLKNITHTVRFALILMI